MDHGGPCKCRYVALVRLGPRLSLICCLCFSDVDHDPVKVARDERKARVSKNKSQQLANQTRAVHGTDTGSRKRDIEKTLATTRTSTASMGKFDKKLEGEKKLRGVKRKVCQPCAWYAPSSAL